MERILTIFMIVTCCYTSLFAQNIFLKTYLEKTIVSPKVGTALGYEFRGTGELGVFYQQAFVTDDTEAPLRFYEKEFYGFFMAASILEMKGFNLKFQIRTGVSNNENFVITPSVLAYYYGFKFLRIGAGIGSRAFRPTLDTSLSLVIPSKSKNTAE